VLLAGAPDQFHESERVPAKPRLPGTGE
jgi:hypothetical protein